MIIGGDEPSSSFGVLFQGCLVIIGGVEPASSFGVLFRGSVVGERASLRGKMLCYWLAEEVLANQPNWFFLISKLI